MFQYFNGMPSFGEFLDPYSSVMIRVAENCLLPWSARENIPPSLDKLIGGFQKLVKFIDP